MCLCLSSVCDARCAVFVWFCLRPAPHCVCCAYLVNCGLAMNCVLLCHCDVCAVYSFICGAMCVASGRVCSMCLCVSVGASLCGLCVAGSSCGFLCVLSC